MTFGDFKKVVTGFMQRAAGVFSPSTVDLLAYAINAARKSAELKLDFEYSKTRGQLDINLTTGASLSSMVYEDTDDALPVKTLRKAFLTINTNEQIPIGIISREQHLERLQRYYSSQAVDLTTRIEIPAFETTRFQVVRFGDNLYLSPADAQSYNGNSDITVKFDVIRWLDDYSADNDTDFLLEHAHNWMLFQTIWQLNHFLKEDARVPVSQSAMDKMWDDVVNWNSTIIQNSVNDANLD